MSLSLWQSRVDSKGACQKTVRWTVFPRPGRTEVRRIHLPPGQCPETHGGLTGASPQGTVQAVRAAPLNAVQEPAELASWRIHLPPGGARRHMAGSLAQARRERFRLSEPRPAELAQPPVTKSGESTFPPGQCPETHGGLTGASPQSGASTFPKRNTLPPLLIFCAFCGIIFFVRIYTIFLCISKSIQNSSPEFQHARVHP